MIDCESFKFCLTYSNHRTVFRLLSAFLNSVNTVRLINDRLASILTYKHFHGRHLPKQNENGDEDEDALHTSECFSSKLDANRNSGGSAHYISWSCSVALFKYALLRIQMALSLIGRDRT